MRKGIGVCYVHLWTPYRDVNIGYHNVLILYYTILYVLIKFQKLLPPSYTHKKGLPLKRTTHLNGTNPCPRYAPCPLAGPPPPRSRLTLLRAFGVSACTHRLLNRSSHTDCMYWFPLRCMNPASKMLPFGRLAPHPTPLWPGHAYLTDTPRRHSSQWVESPAFSVMCFCLKVPILVFAIFTV